MMTNWLNDSIHFWIPSLALTLLHFLWQGTLIGILAFSLDRILKSASANSRYFLHGVALLSLPVCFLLTLSFVEVPDNWIVAKPANLRTDDISTADSVPQAFIHTSNEDSRVADIEISPLPVRVDYPPQTPDAPNFSDTVKSQVDTSSSTVVSQTNLPQFHFYAPLIVSMYGIGVFTCLLRLILALWGGHRLRSASAPIEDQSLLRIISHQAMILGLRLVPVVAYCERVTVPTVVGIIRPIVLIPASIATGLTPDQFAAIISHEFAHIRRFDLLINLLQRLIESLLFFHPVVWYLSKRLSVEREVCCDDLAVTTGSSPVDYAGALLRMAELCSSAKSPGVVTAAATGETPSQLEQRIRRLLTMTHQSQLRLTRMGALLIAFMIFPMVFIPSIILGVVQAQDHEKQWEIDGTFQLQLAVRSPSPKPGDEINAGNWQIATEWKIPIQSSGDPGHIVSEVNGAQVRISWEAVRLLNDGIQFDGFEWHLDNPITRRDGLTHKGIGGKQLEPKSSWFGNEYEWLTSLQLDTATNQQSNRTMVVRARYFPKGRTLKTLNIFKLTDNRSSADDVSAFDQGLRKIHELRVGRKPTVKELEEIVDQLLAEYPQEKGAIHWQAAHVLGQSGIKVFADEVIRHATESIKSEEDPLQRAWMFMYLSNASEVRGSNEDANYWALRGLLELEALNLPKIAPEVPGLGRYNSLLNIGDQDYAAKREIYDRLSSAEQQARAAAKQVKELVRFRSIYLDILRRINRTPVDIDRLSRIIYERIGINMPFQDILKGVFDEVDVDPNIHSQFELRLDALRHISLNVVVQEQMVARYERLLKDFPKHPQRAEALFDLAHLWELTIPDQDVVPAPDKTIELLRQAHASSTPDMPVWVTSAIHLHGRIYRDHPAEAEQLIESILSSSPSTIDELRAWNARLNMVAYQGDDKKVEQIGMMMLKRMYSDEAPPELGTERMQFFRETQSGIHNMLNYWQHKGFTDKIKNVQEKYPYEFIQESIDQLNRNQQENVQIMLNIPATMKGAISDSEEESENISSLILDKPASTKTVADRLVKAAGSPTWKLKHVDEIPFLFIDGFEGYRIVLQREWKEYQTDQSQQSEVQQQVKEFQDDSRPFVLKQEEWEFVLFPLSAKTIAADLKSRIPWKPGKSPYHTQKVYMGEGQGFAWFTNGTLYGQEIVRSKLPLTGGEDRIALMIEGVQINDTHTNTSNTCKHLIANFKDLALPAIQNAIKQTEDKDALWRIISSLSLIKTEAATNLLIELHGSNNQDISKVADYALYHFPLRRAAKEAYFDLLREHRGVFQICNASVEYEWKDAIPILEDLIKHPENLRELSWTIPARRSLEGNPIAGDLLNAKKAIVFNDDPASLPAKRQLLLATDDFEAATLFGIEFATYSMKGGPQKQLHEFGLKLLKNQPQEKVIAFLNDVIAGMPDENTAPAKQLLQKIESPE